MANTKKNGMKVKDIITVTLLSLCSVVIFILFSFLYVMPVFILLFPIFVSLIQGMIFMMIGIKVPKKGAILLYSVIAGLAGMNIIYAIGSVAAGIIGEILLAKTGYGNMKTLGITYIIMQTINAFTSTVYPYAVAFESTKDKVAKAGADLAIYEKANGMLSGTVIVILLIAAAAASFFGALIGSRIMKKHVVNN